LNQLDKKKALEASPRNTTPALNVAHMGSSPFVFWNAKPHQI